MDFLLDTLATGHAIRVWTILDAYPRECLVHVAQARFPGDDNVVAGNYVEAAERRPEGGVHRVPRDHLGGARGVAQQRARDSQQIGIGGPPLD